MTHDETGAVLQMLAAVYRVELADDTHTVWTELLRDTPLRCGLEAARSWSASNEWFPKPAELLRLAVQVAQTEAAAGEFDRRSRLASRCDGSRWSTVVNTDGTRSDELEPCPACNPALAELFADQVKWKRWRQGSRFPVPAGMVTDIPPCWVPA